MCLSALCLCLFVMMVWRVSNGFILLSDRNQQGIPEDTLQTDDIINDMTSVSELSSLDQPRTGVALLLQLLSVKSNTRERTPRYFARGGEKATGRSSSTKVYVFACPNSSTGSNVVMMPFGSGTISQCFCCFAAQPFFPSLPFLFELRP